MARSRLGRPSTRAAVLACLVLFALLLGPLMGGAAAFAGTEATAVALATGVAYGIWSVWLSDRGGRFPSRWLGSEPAVDLAVATLLVGTFAPFFAPLPGLSAILYSLWVLSGIKKLRRGDVAPATPLLFLPGLMSLWLRSGLEQPPNRALVFLAMSLVIALTALAVTRKLAHSADATDQDLATRSSSGHPGDRALLDVNAA